VGRLVLHPEFGLNSTLPVCILCGKDKGDIALLGNACKEKAPMRMLVDAVPCEDCAKQYLETGVMLVEVTEQGSITGKVTVVTDEGFKRIFNIEIPGGKIAMISEEAMRKVQKIFDATKEAS
jgi:hypothetical protein